MKYKSTSEIKKEILEREERLEEIYDLIEKLEEQRQDLEEEIGSLEKDLLIKSDNEERMEQFR